MTPETKTSGFFWNEEFYHEIEDLAIYFEENDEEIPEEMICFKSVLEPVFQLSADWILERIDEERIDENGKVLDKIAELLKAFDFTEFNTKVPKMHFETPVKFKITKQEILDCNDNPLPS